MSKAVSGYKNAVVHDAPSHSAAREIPSWIVSAAAHIAVLAILWTIPIVNPFDPDALVITAFDDEVLEEEFKFDAATAVDVIGNDSDANMLGPSQDAAELAGTENQEKFEDKIEDTLDLSAPLPAPNPVEIPRESMVTDKIETKGATENVGGTEGAIDRIAFEIANSLRDRKTIVLWLFDASLSLKERRDAIADRFENVYAQLNKMNADSDKALKTVVATFGEKTEILTKEPVDEIEGAAELVRNIKPDESGKENVFSAISTVTDRFLTFRTKQRRNMMVVIVTDERGDDAARMEGTIAKLSRYGIRCYVVGNAAVFGRQKGRVKWTYEDGVTDYLPVDQGPESYYPDRLTLSFWGQNGSDLDRISASYGPYALTRLCAETRGLYLIAAENSGPRFSQDIMRNYRPDYRPIRMQDAEIGKSLAKQQLIRAAQATIDNRIPTPTLEFRADTDQVLRNQLTEAQKPLAVLDYSLNQMASLLLMGEKDRENLSEPRWQAAFDLAIGRALAMQVRANGYNIVLAQMKSSPRSFETTGNNTWKLVASDKVSAGPTVRKLAAKATEYLNRVVDEHPGTPWATLAERELSQPLGWAWSELKRDYAAIERRRMEQNTVLFADENTGERRRIPRPQRKKPKL